MIKIFLNCGFAEWEKGNKRYKCRREFNGGKRIYTLLVADVPNHLSGKRIYTLPVADLPNHLRLDNLIRSESLSDINEWLKNLEVEIAEY